MALAGLTQIEDQWRPLTTSEQRTAMVLLDRVSALIRLRHRDIESRVAAEPDFATVVSGIAVDAVLRVMRNPDGKAQESVDDYAYRRADPVADGKLYVTDDEWAQLAPSLATSSGIYVVSLT